MIRIWYYAAPADAVALAGSLGLSVWRVWLQPQVGAGGRGMLPAWPASPSDRAPSLVIGELHHPTAPCESERPSWLVIPETGLYTGILILGAVGSGKTSACMHPFAQQIAHSALAEARPSVGLPSLGRRGRSGLQRRTERESHRPTAPPPGRVVEWGRHAPLPPRRVGREDPRALATPARAPVCDRPKLHCLYGGMRFAGRWENRELSVEFHIAAQINPVFPCPLGARGISTTASSVKKYRGGWLSGPISPASVDAGPPESGRRAGSRALQAPPGPHVR